MKLVRWVCALFKRRTRLEKLQALRKLTTRPPRRRWKD